MNILIKENNNSLNLIVKVWNKEACSNLFDFESADVFDYNIKVNLNGHLLRNDKIVYFIKDGHKKDSSNLTSSYMISVNKIEGISLFLFRKFCLVL